MKTALKANTGAKRDKYLMTKPPLIHGRFIKISFVVPYFLSVQTELLANIIKATNYVKGGAKPRRVDRWNRLNYLEIPIVT